MSTLSVKDILKGIETLEPADRLKLEKELARTWLNSAWRVEAGKARRVARRRKIDQKTIDSVIEQRRYRK